MIYRSDSGVKLIFNIVDIKNEPVDISTAYITFMMVSGNTRVKKIAEKNREEPGQCFVVLDKTDTDVAGSYKYQLTVHMNDSIFSTTTGKLKILNKV